MLFTKTGNIPYREVVEGYRERFGRESAEIIRVCDVPWNHKREFVWYMLGWTEYNGGPNLTRFLPEPLDGYIDHHLDSAFYAAECNLVDSLGTPDIQPEAHTFSRQLRFLDRVPTDPVPDVGEEEFGWARYEVVYRPRTYQVLADHEIDTELDRFVTRNSTPSVINYTIPGNTFLFVDTGKSIPENTVKTEFTQEQTYTWHQVPLDRNGWLPQGLGANIARCQAHANSLAFEHVYPEEWICLAPHFERYQDAHGSRVADIHYKFIHRRATPDTGWNTTYRSKPVPGFYRIIGNDLVTKLYPLEDFHILFQMN